MRAQRKNSNIPTIELSSEDQLAFVMQIIDLPEPNAALQEAFARHKRLVESNRVDQDDAKNRDDCGPA